MIPEERRKVIVDSVLAETVAYYRLIVGTSTIFLGGTLVFWERVTPLLSRRSLVLLSMGWVSLIASIAIVAFIRRSNIECGRLVLSLKFAEAETLGAQARKLSTACGLLLAAGMLFVSAAGMTALWEKAMQMENKTVKTESVETRSLPLREIAGVEGGAKQTSKESESSGGSSPSTTDSKK